MSHITHLKLYPNWLWKNVSENKYLNVKVKFYCAIYSFFMYLGIKKAEELTFFFLESLTIWDSISFQM